MLLEIDGWRYEEEEDATTITILRDEDDTTGILWSYENIGGILLDDWMTATRIIGYYRTGGSYERFG